LLKCQQALPPSNKGEKQKEGINIFRNCSKKKETPTQQNDKEGSSVA